MKKNVIIFTMNRTGSTSACRSLFSINKLIHIDYYENPEFLHSINTYFPPQIKYWIMLIPQIYDAYKERDYEFLNTWYATTSDKLVSFLVEKPILKDNQILCKQYHLNSPKFNEDFPFFLKNKNFYVEEQYRRIDMTNAVAKSGNPIVFKYFPPHINHDTWIDRKYNYVIVLIRDLVDVMASNQLKRINGITNKTAEELTKTSYEEINKNLEKLLNDDKQLSRPNMSGFLSRKITTDDIKNYIKTYSKFLSRVDNIKPDAIISYDWMIKNNIFSHQSLVKLNKFPSKLFYDDFDEAKHLFKEVKTLSLFNLNLAKKLWDIT